MATTRRAQAAKNNVKKAQQAASKKRTTATLDGHAALSHDGYSLASAEEVEDAYAGTDVPGEFRPLTRALETEQLAITLIRIPAHSDFEQGTGHTHDEIEEIYLVTQGTLTMRFGGEIVTVGAGTAVRVSPGTPRSHRNEQDEPVELWAISPKTDDNASTKIDEFWAPSPEAQQHRTP